MKKFRLRFPGLPVLALLLSLGCDGGSQLATAPVQGTVTLNGKSVSGGSLTFQPAADEGEALSGKPATAEVQEDGSYVLTTYEPGDGAVIGKHTVSFTPAIAGGSGAHGQASAGSHAQAPSVPNLTIPADQRTVEVADEENVIDFELVKGE